MSKVAQTVNQPSAQLAVMETYSYPATRKGMTKFTDGTILYWSDDSQLMMIQHPGQMASPVNKMDLQSPYVTLMKSDLHMARPMVKDEITQFDKNFEPIKMREAAMNTATIKKRLSTIVKQAKTLKNKDLIKSVNALVKQADRLVADGDVAKLQNLVNATVQMAGQMGADKTLVQNLHFVRSSLENMLRNAKPVTKGAPPPAPKSAAKEACPTCQGKGYTKTLGTPDKTCQTCGGTGKVNVTKTSSKDDLIQNTKGKTAMMNKTAVDSATTKYWSEYFHEYGAMWVRNIPRRLRLAMRTAAKKEVTGNLAPLAMSKSASGGLDVEASYVNQVGDKVERALVYASFNKEGALTELKVYPV